MKSDKLLNAVGMVDGDLVVRAEKYKNKSKRIHIMWVMPIAAALVVVLLAGVYFGNGLIGVTPDIDSQPYSAIGETAPDAVDFTPVSLAPYCLSKAVYPQRTKAPEVEGGDSDLWFEENRTRRGFYGEGDNLWSFFSKSTEEFLSDSDGANVVYSPLNVYMALSMLAETEQGDSRQQILSILGAEDIQSLRTQVHAIWNANYQDDGITTSILASSLWLNENLTYKQELLDVLAQYYYASVFQGEMGSEEYSLALRTWINEQTGELLKNEISNVELSADTILSLVTTVYFKDQWASKFSVENTYKERFYTPMGYKDIDFMHKTYDSMPYYKGDDFDSVYTGFDGGSTMYFIRPNEGVDVDTLLSDEELYAYLMSDKNDYDNAIDMDYYKVNLAVPKFDVSSTLDLSEGLQKIGVEDCFIPTGADFDVTSEISNVFVSDIQHSARVKIDEEGVEAAAVTIVNFGAGAPNNEEIDFVLDRPFIFVITNDDGLPIFTGVVNNP